MKRVKQKKHPGVVFGPASLERIPPPSESAKGRAAGDPSVVELKTQRVVRFARCPICGVRPAALQVQIGPVAVGVCEPCASPVSTGLSFFAALKKFL